MRYDVLYYPWIEPTNRLQLATSVLYWDHLYTIVPQTMGMPYRERWTRTAYEYGFLRPRFVYRECPEVTAATDEFIADIERRPVKEHVREIRSARSLMRQAQRLHFEKVAPDFYARVSDALGSSSWRSHGHDAEGFYRVRSAYAAAYMSRLASVIADRDRLSPFTELKISQNLLVDRFSQDFPDDIVGLNEAILATLSFNAIQIGAGTSFGDLIRFRDAHYDELVRYRKAVRGFARQASGIVNGEFRRKELERIARENLFPSQEEIEAKMGEANLDFSLNAMHITSAAVVGGAVSGPKGAIAGALVALVYAIVRWRLAKSKIPNEPLAYLAGARQTLTDKPELRI